MDKDQLNKPDWKGFGEAVMEEFGEHRDLSAEDKFDFALKFHIIKEVPGGFDPEVHVDAFDCGVEPGDPWYMPNY
jgi:hypothetical protein